MVAATAPAALSDVNFRPGMWDRMCAVMDGRCVKGLPARWQSAHMHAKSVSRALHKPCYPPAWYQTRHSQSPTRVRGHPLHAGTASSNDRTRQHSLPTWRAIVNRLSFSPRVFVSWGGGAAYLHTPLVSFSKSSCSPVTALPFALTAGSGPADGVVLASLLAWPVMVCMTG